MSLWPKDSQGKLSKTFLFKNYRQSFGFVSQIVLLAEKKNHHPTITLEYGSVTIALISHDVNEITERDIDLAKQIDKIYDQ
ncbi:4a-hydroxytetrahydrobiopterin dehydratase [Alphaproteobacteria bacterium]|jgi:4a-hydroxytetrahydrobiopterin dehydratase|nr:4a-hydroxytetrahydrobiopterin dehydratase [Alphaproteobacteria bacterium]MDB3863857.1 4a-hydroxytetrahydrobiopterin dehydratase [Alphaproteobacteria bacterium]|tara:strand:+ start:246 stop:488 length:243 start_codon:yes stop_codon:yes gene_type:complete